MCPRADDSYLGDEELLYRRIWDTPEWTNAKALEKGILKPSSVAFLDQQNEVSVSVASMTTVETALEGYPNHGLVAIKAAVPRSLGSIVALTPEIDDPSHRVICPPDNSSKSQRKSVARVMADHAKWIVLPASKRQLFKYLIEGDE